MRECVCFFSVANTRHNLLRGCVCFQQMLTPLAVSPAFSITGRIRASTLTGTISFFQLPPDHSNPLFIFRTRYCVLENSESTKVHKSTRTQCTHKSVRQGGRRPNTGIPGTVPGTFVYRGTGALLFCVPVECVLFAEATHESEKEKGGHTFPLPSEPQRSYEKPRWLHIWGPRCLFALCFPFYLWRHSLLVHARTIVRGGRCRSTGDAGAN